MKKTVETSEEKYVESRASTNDFSYLDLRLTDAGLILALDERTTLLTTDSDLFEHALSRGLQAVNFHHVREERGTV